MQKPELVVGLFSTARSALEENVADLSLEEALFAAGGYRSILGVLKHLGGWAHVYRSYAFDSEPRHWAQTAWPRGLRDTVELDSDYVEEVVSWAGRAIRDWETALQHASEEELEEQRLLHWGGRAPLWNIAITAAHHVGYHTGEVNMLLSIARAEAWEYTEEVEENHIDTYGHGVRAAWMSDAAARAHEEMLRATRVARSGGPDGAGRA